MSALSPLVSPVVHARTHVFVGILLKEYVCCPFSAAQYYEKRLAGVCEAHLKHLLLSTSDDTWWPTPSPCRLVPLAVLKPTLKELGLCPNSLAVLADACYLGARREDSSKGSNSRAGVVKAALSRASVCVSLTQRVLFCGTIHPRTHARTRAGSASQFGILFGAVLMLPAVSRLDIALSGRKEAAMAEEICVRLLEGEVHTDDEEECRATYGCAPPPSRVERLRLDPSRFLSAANRNLGQSKFRRGGLFGKSTHKLITPCRIKSPRFTRYIIPMIVPLSISAAPVDRSITPGRRCSSESSVGRSMAPPPLRKSSGISKRGAPVLPASLQHRAIGTLTAAALRLCTRTRAPSGVFAEPQAVVQTPSPVPPPDHGPLLLSPGCPSPSRRASSA